MDIIQYKAQLLFFISNIKIVKNGLIPHSFKNGITFSSSHQNIINRMNDAALSINLLLKHIFVHTFRLDKAYMNSINHYWDIYKSNLFDVIYIYNLPPLTLIDRTMTVNYELNDVQVCVYMETVQKLLSYNYSFIPVLNCDVPNTNINSLRDSLVDCNIWMYNYISTYFLTYSKLIQC